MQQTIAAEPLFDDAVRPTGRRTVAWLSLGYCAACWTGIAWGVSLLF